MYKSISPLNEESIFENVFLMVINVNNDTKRVVNIKIISLTSRLLQFLTVFYVVLTKPLISI